MSKKQFAKRILPMILTAGMLFTSVPVMAAFHDLEGHWAKKVITEWQDAGLIKGYTDGTFKQDRNITRAEFVTVMNHALGLKAEGEENFSDVKESNWYCGAVTAAMEAGYCKGYTDGTFKPSATITRAEAAVMIANAAGMEENNVAAEAFADAAAIPAWAKGSVGAVVEAGFMSNYPDGSFGPVKPITRAKAVSFLDHVMDSFEAEEEITEGTTEAEDLIITEGDTVIEDGVITGNLIIDEAVGEGEVYLNDVVVEGDIIVKGGGDDSIYFNNVTVKGKIKVNKKGVRLHLSGDTKIPDVEVMEVFQVTSENFEGEVGTITLLDDLGIDTSVVIDVAADAVVVERKTSVVIEADVQKVQISEDAEGAKIEVAKNAAVETIVANAKVNLTGGGKVENLEANASGITVNKNLKIEKTETESGVSKPTTSTGTTSGGGSASQKPSGGSSVILKDVTAKADEGAFKMQVNKNAYSCMNIQLEGAKLKEDAALTVTPAFINGLTLTAVNTEEGGLADGWQASVMLTGTPIATTDGTVSCTVTIPKDALVLENGYQATEDSVVFFTVEIVAAKYEVENVTIAQQDVVNMQEATISLNVDKNLITEAAALAYLQETYETVTLTGSNAAETKTVTANVTGWTFDPDPNDAYDTYPTDAVKTATETAPVILDFVAVYEMPENFEDHYNPITVAVNLQITAAQTEAEGNDPTGGDSDTETTKVSYIIGREDPAELEEDVSCCDITLKSDAFTQDNYDAVEIAWAKVVDGKTVVPTEAAEHQAELKEFGENGLLFVCVVVPDVKVGAVYKLYYRMNGTEAFKVVDDNKTLTIIEKAEAAVDKTPLENTIQYARMVMNEVLAEVRISETGDGLDLENLAENEKWIPSSAVTALEGAIQNAEFILKEVDAAQYDLDLANTTLRDAVMIFSNAVQVGIPKGETVVEEIVFENGNMEIIDEYDPSAVATVIGTNLNKEVRLALAVSAEEMDFGALLNHSTLIDNTNGKWQARLPRYDTPGTYYVWYKIDGTDMLNWPQDGWVYSGKTIILLPKVIVEDVDFGDVWMERDLEAGTATINVTPDSGYEVESVTYTTANNSEPQTVTEQNGKYTFAVPKESVTVAVNIVEGQEHSIAIVVDGREDNTI